MSFPLGRIWRSIRSLTALFKSCLLKVNLNLNKTILQSIYLLFLLSYYLQSLYLELLYVKTGLTPLMKRSKQKDKLNHRLVLTTAILLSTSIYVICKGFTHHRRCKREEKMIFFKQMLAKIKLNNLRLKLRFHHDFTKKIFQFPEQTNVTLKKKLTCSSFF